ncbi:unnamed protein product [Orchesella dallaii]|uniref:Uncharacterized protein n=1 Tax=Orchesella dallaii TaxID=48710 RepID=A0ABP1REW4_9HEXA
MGLVNWIILGTVLLVFNWESTSCHKRFEVDRNIKADEKIPLNDWTSYDHDGATNWLNLSLWRTKRAAFGILRLATKRPHKTAAQLNHLPPQDAFMSVRGRKRSHPYSYPNVDSFRYFDEMPTVRILASLNRFRNLNPNNGNSPE